MSEQEIALTFAEAFAAVAPDRGDPVDLGLHLRGNAAVREARPDVHRHMAAQRLKSGMELGANRTSDSARVGIPRPELERGEGFGKVFTDRQTVPDHEFPVTQRRD